MPNSGLTSAPARAMGVPRTKRDDLELLVNSRNPIVTVETGEEPRFVELLERVAVDLGISRAMGVPRTKRDDLELLVNSRNPIVTVETGEEPRFVELLERVAVDLGIPLY